MISSLFIKTNLEISYVSSIILNWSRASSNISSKVLYFVVSTPKESVEQDSPIEIEDNSINNSFEEKEEQSLLEEVVNNPSNDNTQNTETALTVSPRNLSPLYILRKKIKISFLKVFKFIPRLLNKKFNEN